MEDLAYRRMLDEYYLREGPLPAESADVARLIGMREHVTEVEAVLREFFSLTDNGWRHSRCEEELAKMQDKQAKARASAQASVNARRAKPTNSENERSANVERTLNERSTDVELPTPTPTPTPALKAERERATRIPAGFPNNDAKRFCETERPDLDAELMCQKFRDHYVSKPKGTQLDWMATWRNWVRSEKPQSRPYQQAPPRKTARDVQIETMQKLTGYTQHDAIEG